MRRVLHLNPASGAAGDMLLAALVGLGADSDAVLDACRALPVEGWRMDFEQVRRGGLAATAAVVSVDPSVQPLRRPADLLAILGAADLPEPTVRDSSRVIAALASAEAAVHGCDLDEVHLHEVGAVDTLLDVVGVITALGSLDVDLVVCAPVATGSGSLDSAHGVLPVPAPAVLRLLEGRPLVGTGVDAELTTPTGAALLAAIVDTWAPFPPMTLTTSSYGAGTRELPGRPNVLQAFLGDLLDPDVVDAPMPRVEALVELATNLDDVTGEVLAHTVDALLADGALDAWVSPIVMKKGRPAHTLHVLGRHGDLSALVQRIVAETGSLGVRHQSVQRRALPRSEVTVELDGVSVRVKVGPHGAKAEHDDLASAARRLGRSLVDVKRSAEALAYRHPQGARER
jgi:uncharacterized protein (TIGR00299 family) protein